MQFDPENKVVKLCAAGMAKEVSGCPDEAAQLFLQAWHEATNDFERFTAAHYVARHQNTVADKLKWDETALNLASKLSDENVKSSYPSLYLNIAKCYEDLENFPNALKYYRQALSYVIYLPDDGYGRMIQSGIENGIARVSTKDNSFVNLLGSGE
jgi:tetratricopeptide (TPR) repeat protein